MTIFYGYKSVQVKKNTVITFTPNLILPAATQVVVNVSS